MGDFGVELARLRTRRGWTVRELAWRASVSDGQICNLESGRRNPTPTIARACDTALDAGGLLVELAETARRRPAPTPITVEADALIAGYGRILAELKDLGRSTGPEFVDGSLRSIAQNLTDTATRPGVGHRDEIWLLASKFAEYTGWMAQEAGNPAEAMRWTDLAVRWGANGGDETMAAYAYVRRASIAELRGDAEAAIRLAGRAALHPAATPLIRAHAARREAQGHASLGDHEACREAFERSRSHAQQDDRRGTRWGPRIENGNPRLIEASCLIRLRRFEQAADLFAAELEHHPDVPSDSNSRTRFAIRHATALAGLDHLDHACHVVDEHLPTIRRLDSASIRAELGRFVDQAQRRKATPGQRGVIQAAAGLAQLRQPGRTGAGLISR